MESRLSMKTWPRWNHLVTETSQRLYGLSALIEMIGLATPEVEIRERDALKELANEEKWDFSDFSVEDQSLDIKFGYWLPKLAHYSVIILLSSLVETQLLGYAKSVGQRNASVFDPSDLRGSILEKTALYVTKVSGLQLKQNPRWQLLNDLQELRNVIVHRAGKPPEDKDKRRDLEQMMKRYQGLSLVENFYSIDTYSQLDVSIYTCKAFAGEVEAFFKGLFKDDGLPVETGLWPNIENRFT
jgi:hypothetical protein